MKSLLNLRKKNNEEIKSLRKGNSYLTKRLGVDGVVGENSDELSIKVIEHRMNQKIKPEDIDRSHWHGNSLKSINANNLDLL